MSVHYFARRSSSDSVLPCTQAKVEQSKGKQTGTSTIDISTGGAIASEVRKSVRTEDDGMGAGDGILKRVNPFFVYVHN